MGNNLLKFIQRAVLLSVGLWTFFLSPSLGKAENGEILFGGAAITAAVSAMVVPGMMAQGQVNIAQTRSQASLAVSGINSQTQLFQAQLNAQTALSQAMVARDTAMYSQQAQSRDLLSQLQFLAYNRALDNQLSREKMMGDLRLQQSLLELEYKKMELNQVLAQTQALASATTGSVTPNVYRAEANTRSENPLAAALGANSKVSSQSEQSLGESSLGLRRVLNASISTGSTRKRGFSDLSQFSSASLAETGFTPSEGGVSRRARGISSITSSSSRATHGLR